MAAHPLVGRDRELSEIRAALDRTAAGEFIISHIEGGPCSGKGAFLREVELYARQKGAAVFYGASRGWEVPEPMQDVSDAINRELARMGEDRSFPDCRFLIPTGVAERIDTSRAKATGRNYEKVWKFIQGLAGGHPIILCFNNFQWASPATCHFIEYLAGHPDRKRTMLCIAYRPEEITGPDDVRARLLEHLNVLYPVHRILLGHLYPQEVGVLIQTVLGCAPNTELVNYIVRESGGNPAHVLWLVRFLVQNKSLECGTGNWLGGPPDPRTAQSLPLREMVKSIYLGLPVAQRELLKAIAVSGWAAPATILDEVMETGPADIEKLAEGLSEAMILDISDKNGTPVFHFREGLVQEVVYDQLRGDECRSLHWRTGNAVEKYLIGTPEGSLFSLAHHFSKTGDIGKAIQYVTMAGDLATEMAAGEEALSYYESALVLQEWEEDSLPKKQGELRLLSRLGDISYLQNSPERALEYHVRALRLAEELGENGRRAEFLVRMGTSYLCMGEWSLALKEQLRGLAGAIGAGDARSAALARISIAHVYTRIEAFHKARQYLSDVLPSDLSDSEMKRTAASVYLEIASGILEGSRELIEKAQALYKALDDSDGELACQCELKKLQMH